MNDLFHARANNRRQSEAFVNRLQIFIGLFHWLVDLVFLTEEEQKEAGIYLGYQPFK